MLRWRSPEQMRAMSLHGAWARRDRKRKAQLALLAVELAAAEADLAQKVAAAQAAQAAAVTLQTPSPRRATRGKGARATGSPAIPPAVLGSALRAAARSLPRVLGQMRTQTQSAPVSTGRLPAAESSRRKRSRQTRGTTRLPGAIVRAGIRSLFAAAGYIQTAPQGAEPSLAVRGPRLARRSRGQLGKAAGQVNAGGVK